MSEPFPQSEPRHGDQGDRRPSLPRTVPANLSVAVSRESGARGHGIARHVGRKLGWQVYDQELLEYLAQEGPTRERLLAEVLAAVTVWVEERLAQLRPKPELEPLARLVLCLGGQGGAVFVGRGAGLLLPAETTLHVRVVAPVADRVAYMAQWLRLTVEEAAEQVRQRDARRAEFWSAHFNQLPSDVYLYDLVLNSSRLGEERGADLIAQAARAKQASLGEQGPRSTP